MQFAREERTLKVAGLSAMAIALVPFLFLSERLGNSEWARGTDSNVLSWMALAWLAAAEVLAGGLLSLLAGLNGAPLLSSPRARRGALLKLTGMTMLIALFALTQTYSDQGVPARWPPRPAR